MLEAPTAGSRGWRWGREGVDDKLGLSPGALRRTYLSPVYPSWQWRKASQNPDLAELRASWELLGRVWPCSGPVVSE